MALPIDGGTAIVLSTTTYDVDGTATTTVNEADGGVVSSRRYDDFGDLIEVSSPDMGTVYYQYNGWASVYRWAMLRDVEAAEMCEEICDGR